MSLRSQNGKTRKVELVRALVPPETVVTTRVGDLLLLRITGFSSDTGTRLAHEIVRGMVASPPPRGLVLDLRDNRGGLLRQAVAAADTLIPNGIVATTQGRDPAAAHEFRADGADLARGLPVVVMVDGRSASAAEILAAALADHGRAVVLGSSTLGKGLVQTIASLPDGGELFITWSRVLAPRGWPIQGLGVLPQVCTSLGIELAGPATTRAEAGQFPDGAGATAPPLGAGASAAGRDAGNPQRLPSRRRPRYRSADGTHPDRDPSGLRGGIAGVGKVKPGQAPCLSHLTPPHEWAMSAVLRGIFCHGENQHNSD